MGKTDYIQTAVRLDFASPRLFAPNEIDRISQAVDYAASNLYHNYNIVLEAPFITDENSVVVYVKIPKKEIENFNYGIRLRGISAYLLKHYPDQYKNYRIGPRLLYYTVIKKGDIPKSKDRNVIKLELITKFINLITNSTTDELKQIEKALNKFT